MLLDIVNAVKFTQNYTKLPKFAKVYPIRIRLKSFEIPSKFEIFIFFTKKNPMHREATKACAYPSDLQYKNFPYVFFYCHLLSKNGLGM
jgi:hypothetical protein